MSALGADALIDGITDVVAADCIPEEPFTLGPVGSGKSEIVVPESETEALATGVVDAALVG